MRIPLRLPIQAVAFLFPILLSGLTGCSNGRIIPLEGHRPAYPYRTTGAHSGKWQMADSLWELRIHPDAARRSLEAYRAAVKRTPKIPELQARLSHACNFVATYLTESPAKKDVLVREGERAAEKAMLLNPRYAAKFRETGDEVEAAEELDSGYVEALYWYVANLGRELNQESVIVRRGNRSRLESLNNRLLQLNPGFFYAGPHRIAGAIPTRLPEGDLEKSKAHFETAIAMAPGYQGNRLAYAEFYAVRAKDKRLFVEQLNLIIASDEKGLKEVEPENHLAREQAKRLLLRTEELFR